MVQNSQYGSTTVHQILQLTAHSYNVYIAVLMCIVIRAATSAIYKVLVKVIYYVWSKLCNFHPAGGILYMPFKKFSLI